MRFGVLGSLEVHDGDRVVDLGGQKQKAVLAILLIDANRVVPLERIADDLWGDRQPPSAVASLQAYISNLRRQLEPDRLPREPARVLLTRSPGYLVSVAPDDVDAARFERLAAEGRALLAGGNPLRARGALEEALASWRGPAYADFAAERFAQVEASRLEALRAVAREDLLEAALGLGEHARAVAELERLVTEHPLRERGWSMLMLALYRSGRQAEALQAFHTARRTFAEELGIDPGPGLRRIEEQILRQAPELDWLPPTAEVALSARQSPAGAVAYDPAPTLAHASPAGAGDELVVIGREEQLQALDRALSAVAAGRGASVAISGPPGIGKSHLARAFAARASSAGARVLWGRSLEGEAPAYWPWTQMLRSLLNGPDGAALRERLPSCVAGLAPMMPEATPHADASADGGGGAARGRLHDLVVQVLAEAAKSRPLALLIDDLQWADPASLQLAEFLAAQIPEVPLLVVALHREVAPTNPASMTLGALARTPGAVELTLGGLTVDGVAAFVRRTARVEPAPDVAEALHRRTAGNPFFVSEMVRLLAGEHRLESACPEDVLQMRVPQGVRDVIRRRLAFLPQQAKVLLDIAAVAGREFDMRVVERASRLEQDVAMDLLETAIVTGLLHEEPEQVQFRFAHDLVRETLLQDLSGIRRARLHLRIAEAVNELARLLDRPTQQLAHHLWAARAVAPADEVLQALMASARESLAHLAFEDADEQLRRAFALIAELPPSPERARHELRAWRSLVALRAATDGYASSAVAAGLERARAVLREVEDPAAEAGILYGLWGLAFTRGDIDAAERWARQLLALAEQRRDESLELAGCQAFGVTIKLLGDGKTGLEYLERGIALAQRLPASTLVPRRGPFVHDPEVWCRVYAGVASWMLGNVDGARAEAEHALAVARRLEHPLTLTFALHLNAYLAALMREPAAAAHHAAEGRELAESYGFPYWVAICGIVEGWGVAVTEDPIGGRRMIRHGIDALHATGSGMLVSFNLALLAEAELLCGDGETALELIDTAIAEGASRRVVFFEPEPHRLRGEFLLAVAPDADAEAARSLETAVEIAARHGLVALEARARESLERTQRASRA